MRAVCGALALTILVTLSAPAAPQAAVGSLDVSISAAAGRALEQQVRLHKLSNGMVFLLLPRHDAPVFSGIIQFKVGGLDEPPGQSGIAHLFEHLAFQGTPRIGGRDPERELPLLDQIEEQFSLLREEESQPAPDPGRVRGIREKLAALKEEHRKLTVPNEFLQIYGSQGAVGLNASTDKDFTTYYVSLPANRLELWFLMESERLRRGVLRDFYGERDVVLEERRMRVEIQPFGKLFEALIAAAFENGPYALPTIGLAEDLKRLTTAEALKFRRAHYRPENAVAALVGDFKVEETLRLIEHYFGSWKGEPLEERPAGAATPAAPPTGPAAGGSGWPRRVEIRFPSEPYLLIGFPKPVHPHPDAVTFEVMDGLLSAGRSSILHRRLVTERRLALDIGTFEAPGDRLDNLFVVAAIPLAPHTGAEVESAILEELALLASSPVPQRELERVRNQFQASFLDELGSNSGMALALAHHQLLHGDWKMMLRLLEQVERVGAAEVQKVAARYFRAEQRATAELISGNEEEGEEREAAGGRP